MKHLNHPGRREFIKKSTLAIGGTLLSPAVFSISRSHNKPLKLGLIGCGARGSGAAVQALMAAPSVALTSVGDVFRDKIDECLVNLNQTEQKGQVMVEEKKKFTGFDSYQKVIENSDVVILATPPPFRPEHFEAAVKAGKQVFMEKALSVDVPGYHRILEAGKLADQKGLNVVVGLQFRYQKSFQELLKKVNEGAIGRVLSLDVYFNVGAPVIHERQPGWTEMEYQLRNWRYFEWLWGGQLAGQTIHQIDVMNWLMNDYPITAKGLGGRQSFSGPSQGHTYDHYYVEFKYPNGVKMHVTGATMDRCWGRMGFDILGTGGTANEKNMILDHDGKVIWHHRDDEDPNAFEVEHQVFFDAVLNGKHINNTEYGAKSTLTTLMGRMAVHSGREMELETVLKSTKKITPQEYSWAAKMPVEPGKDGNYPVDVPGRTEVL